MNTVLSFYERQMGLSNDRNYDIALGRLSVHSRDSWRGISPTYDSVTYNPTPPIYSAKFANLAYHEHLLALANEDGKIAIHNTNTYHHDSTTDGHLLEGFQCHFNAVCDLAWMPGYMKIVSASSDSKARLWDVSESQFVLMRTFDGHLRSIKTVAFQQVDPSVFATGGRDGAILIWDTRATSNVNWIPRAENCIYSGHAGSSEQIRTKRTPNSTPNACKSSITGLAFQDDYTLISCGAGDGVIKVWDMRRNYTSYKKEPLPKYSLPYGGISTFKGFTNLVIDNSRFRLYVSCMDNTIYCYNISTYSPEPIQKYTGFTNGSYYIRACLSPDGQYLMSGSSDEKAYIWNVDNSQPIVSLHGHDVEVSCVAWSNASDLRLVTCSDDARHKIWRVAPAEMTNDEKIWYRGHAEFCKEYKNRFKGLEKTPKSLKKLTDLDQTPNFNGAIAVKRSFAELADGNLSDFKQSEAKRPFHETRGRRLFGNVSSTSSSDVGLSTINEESDIKLLPSSPVKSANKLSPLSERINLNLKSPETPSSSHQRVSMNLFSPTSNLPNYVVDGEAPHLRLMSPKRKLKENVDWLTKIRKQKLMSSASSSTSVVVDHKIEQSIRSESPIQNAPCSPRVQSIKSAECSGRVIGTPRRRKSRSNSSSDHPQTPSSSRRSSTETSILRFFSLTPNTASCSK